MRRLLAGVALSTLLFASGANATNHVLTLTGDMANFTSDSFMSDGVLYETGLLELTGFDAFTLHNGDTVEVAVGITGAAFNVPIRDSMFFGLNFDNVLGGAQPEDSTSSGLFSFDAGLPVGAGCGNCVSLIYGQSNAPLSFTNLFATGAFTIGADYEVKHITVSYQANNDAVAVPEPVAVAVPLIVDPPATAFTSTAIRPHTSCAVGL